MAAFHPITVSDIRQETSESVSIGLAVPEDLAERFDFLPGQYLTLRTEIGGEDVRRCYSICSGLDDGEIRIGVKRVEGGTFSVHANQALKAGDVLDVLPPQGRFIAQIEPDRAKTYLAVAAGSGITPILSIAKSVLSGEPGSRFTLIYANRRAASVMFAEALEDLKDRFMERFRVVHVLSREQRDVALFSGRIDAEKIKSFCSNVVDASELDHVFLCGPPPMTAEASAALQAIGVDGARIHIERFSLDGMAPPQGRQLAEPGGRPKTAEVEAVLDGTRHRFAMRADDPNVIDAAARNGLVLPHSCKGGMCCTCRCLIVEGKGEMAVNYSLEPWELEEGFTLACQTTPTSKKLVLDFDAV